MPQRRASGPGRALQSVPARFLYGPRGPGFGAVASTSAAISSMLQSRSATPAAMAGLMRSVLCCRTKLYQTVYSEQQGLVRCPPAALAELPDAVEARDQGLAAERNGTGRITKGSGIGPGWPGSGRGANAGREVRVVAVNCAGRAGFSDLLLLGEV